MDISFSYLTLNIVLTVFVGLFVTLLPLIDRKICAMLDVNVEHSLAGPSRESRLLRLRKLILYTIFFIYLGANVYLVFFSRSASEDYLVHVAPLNDLLNSVRIDSGILGMLTEVYTQGLSEGFSHVHIEKPEDIAQIYMNIMLYVPMGYLLPYVFEWCRAKVRLRPVLYCLFFSFITENLQLVFRRGFYDVDDLLANTFGGLVGQSLYVTLAYVADNPDWREKLRETRRWRRKARKLTLYPFANKIGMARTTLVVTDPSVVTDFYVQQLGFRPIREIRDETTHESKHLLQIGSFQLEIRCSPNDWVAGDQYLTLSVKNVSKIRKRLNRNGFIAGELQNDPYTGQQSLTISGPEKVRITFIQT